MTSVFFIDEGDWVILKGKTRHGKNRINQHGERWTIIELRHGKMLLESSERTDKGGFDWRWVDMHDDKNFTWENVE